MKPDFKTMKIAVISPNLMVGDVTGNLAATCRDYDKAVADGAEMVFGVELQASAYPPKDNLTRTAFVQACKDGVKALAKHVGDVPLVIGTPWPAKTPGEYGQKSYNAFVVLQNGRVVFRTYKRYPAQGGVFDEWRVHKPGRAKVFTFRGVRFGFPICEDIWHDPVVDSLVRQGVDVFMVPNGSPTYMGKPRKRHDIVTRHVQRTGKAMLYNNYVGGQDEHGFDGGAFWVNPKDAKANVFAPYWQPSVSMVMLAKTGNGFRFQPVDGQVAVAEPAEMDFMLDGLVTITRDYILKSSSIRKVVIGISGGVDSAIVLALAVMAVGKENVIAVSMPSRHNSDVTKEFAQKVCDNFGVKLEWWPIQDSVDQLARDYERVFGHLLKVPGNVAYENLQSRVRGQILMAIANREHAMVLSTGNKSEMAMGYATLYGDMNGGFNPLKTIYKTDVYRLGFAINTRLGFEAIPTALITQKPSAELDDNQFDENTLPPYPVLDAILRRYMDDGLDLAEIMAEPDYVCAMTPIVIRFAPIDFETWTEHGLDKRSAMQRWVLEKGRDYDTYLVHLNCVEAVINRLLANQFKRYQAPPGATMTPTGFDDGWKFPIANAMRA